MEPLAREETKKAELALADVLAYLIEAQACAELGDRHELLLKLDGIASTAHEMWQALLPEPVPEEGDILHMPLGVPR